LPRTVATSIWRVWSLSLDDGPEMAADPDRDRDAALLPALGRDTRLHHDRSTHRVVDRRERGHHFIADRLDHGAVEVVGRILHHVEADGDRLAGLGITELVVQLCAADDVREQNCDFEVLCHFRL
jgi:hypothetical protein